MESEKSRSKWLPCERFLWNACARGDSLECVVRLEFWVKDISSSAGCVMTMTVAVAAASQPTDELHTVSCWVRPAKVETVSIPYRSILTLMSRGWMYASGERDRRAARRMSHWAGHWCGDAVPTELLVRTCNPRVVVCIQATARGRLLTQMTLTDSSKAQRGFIDAVVEVR